VNRVAIVCGAGIVSGKEIMALELGEGLRDIGIDVHFVTSRWGSGQFAKRAEAQKFPTHRLWLGFISATLRPDAIWMTLDQVWHWPSLVSAYRRFLKAVRPHRIVHTNWHHLLLLAPLLRPERDILWLHEVIADRPRFRRLFHRFNRRLACFVAVSRAVAESLANLGIPEARIRRVYNGLRDPAGGHEHRQSNHVATVGIAGQIAPWKGHEDLLRAFQLVCRNSSAAQLHIFGSGLPDYELKLRELAHELAIGDRVTWHGFVADRVAIYGDLAVLVVPSQSEDPLPTSAIEAAFFGIPVVASRRGGLPEIIEDGVTGLLFESANSQEMARHLLTLLGNNDLRKKMGRNARERAIMHFSRGRFVQDFAHLLQLTV
jgi:glycosyltransferase involved in cell wall biosynthesis